MRWPSRCRGGVAEQMRGRSKCVGGAWGAEQMRAWAEQMRHAWAEQMREGEQMRLGRAAMSGQSKCVGRAIYLYVWARVMAPSES